MNINDFVNFLPGMLHGFKNKLYLNKVKVMKSTMKNNKVLFYNIKIFLFYFFILNFCFVLIMCDSNEFSASIP